jgi:8-oxo-dGTP diphosphatase
LKSNLENTADESQQLRDSELDGRNADRIQVCCALIIEHGKLLACRRSAVSEHALEWEFPGGKIEHGETEEACLIREIGEELAVDVSIIQKLQPVNYNYPFKNINLIPFLCRIDAGQLNPAEHDSLMWFSPDEFEAFNWSAADRFLIETNLQKIILWV